VTTFVRVTLVCLNFIVVSQHPHSRDSENTHKNLCKQTLMIVKYKKNKHSSRLSNENLFAVLRILILLRIIKTSLQVGIKKKNEFQAQKPH